MAKITVHFIRHGLTRGNIAGRFIGWTDILLTEKGREELKRLKEEFEYPKVDQVFSSPMVRTRETADVFFPEQEPILIPGLKEFYFGDLEEAETREVARQIDIKKWVAHELDCRFPGGESVLEARLRVMGAMTGIFCRCEENGWKEIAVVAHGAIIRTLMEACLETTEDMRNFMITPNGMGLTVAADTKKWFQTQKFSFVKYLPEGAKRPDPSEFPFYKLLKEMEEEKKEQPPQQGQQEEQSQQEKREAQRQE